MQIANGRKQCRETGDTNMKKVWLGQIRLDIIQRCAGTFRDA